MLQLLRFSRMRCWNRHLVWCLLVPHNSDFCTRSCEFVLVITDRTCEGELARNISLEFFCNELFCRRFWNVTGGKWLVAFQLGRLFYSEAIPFCWLLLNELAQASCQGHFSQRIFFCNELFCRRFWNVAGGKWPVSFHTWTPYPTVRRSLFAGCC